MATTRDTSPDGGNGSPAASRFRSGAPAWLGEVLQVLELRRQVLLTTVGGLVLLGLLAAFVLPQFVPPRPAVGAAVGLTAVLLGVAVALGVDSVDLTIRGPRHVRASGGRLAAEATAPPTPDSVRGLVQAVAERIAAGGRAVVGLAPVDEDAGSLGWQEALAQGLSSDGFRVLTVDLDTLSEERSGVAEVAAGEARLAEAVRFDQEHLLARLGPGRDRSAALSAFSGFVSRLPPDIDVLVVALPAMSEGGALGAVAALDRLYLVVENDRTARVDLIATLDAVDATGAAARVLLVREPEPEPVQPSTPAPESDLAADADGEDGAEQPRDADRLGAPSAPAAPLAVPLDATPASAAPPADPSVPGPLAEPEERPAEEADDAGDDAYGAWDAIEAQQAEAEAQLAAGPGTEPPPLAGVVSDEPTDLDGTADGPTDLEASADEPPEHGATADAEPDHEPPADESDPGRTGDGWASVEGRPGDGDGEEQTDEGRGWEPLAPGAVGAVDADEGDEADGLDDLEVDDTEDDELRAAVAVAAVERAHVEEDDDVVPEVDGASVREVDDIEHVGDVGDDHVTPVADVESGDVGDVGTAAAHEPDPASEDADEAVADGDDDPDRTLETPPVTVPADDGWEPAVSLAGIGEAGSGDVRTDPGADDDDAADHHADDHADDQGAERRVTASREPFEDEADLPQDPVRMAAALRSLAQEVWSREERGS